MRISFSFALPLGYTAAAFLLYLSLETAPRATAQGIAPTPLPTATPITGSNVQSPYDPPYAAITYPPADPTSQTVTVFTPCPENKFALVGLQPGQAVNVVVQYPPSQALEIVNLTAPDGGLLLPPT